MNYSLIIPHYNSTVLLRRVLDSVGRNLNVQTIVLENCRQTQIGIPFPYGHLVQRIFIDNRRKTGIRTIAELFIDERNQKSYKATPKWV